MSLGARIKKLRKEKKITQNELGAYLNVVKSTVSQYEHDINTPDPYMIKKLADFFEVTADYILCRTNERKSLQDSADLDLEDLICNSNIRINGILLGEQKKQEIIDLLRNYSGIREI